MGGYKIQCVDTIQHRNNMLIIHNHTILCPCKQRNSKKTQGNKIAPKFQKLGHTVSQVSGVNDQYGRTSRKTQSNKLAPEIRKLGDTGSQASDVYAYGHILEDLSVIRCLPTGEREKRIPYSGAGMPNRPLRISSQGSFRNQEPNNNAKFTKVSFDQSVELHVYDIIGVG